MTTDLFVNLAHTEIRRVRYDARRKIQHKDYAHLHGLSGLCLSSIEEPTDIPETVFFLFENSIKSRNKAGALVAFWAYHAPKLKLARAETRLLVNPPVGLKLPEGSVVTLKTESNADVGEYGQVISRLDDPLIVRQVGYTFTEVDLFSPMTELPREVYLRVKPSSVVAVFEPSKRNNFWLTFLDIRKPALVPPKDLGLSLIPVFADDLGDVELNVYGVEAAV
jgi:hypothetical protein